MADEPMKNPYKDGVEFAQLAKDDPEFAKVLKSNSQLDFSDPAAVLQLTKSLLKRHFNLTIDLPDDRLCPPVPNRLNYLLFIDSLLRSSTPLTIPKSSSATSNATRASGPETKVILEPSSSTQDITDVTDAPTTASVEAKGVAEIETKGTLEPSPSGRYPVEVATQSIELHIDANSPPSLATSNPLPILGLDIGTGASAIYPLLGCLSNPTWSFLATEIDPKSLLYARQNILVNGLEDRIMLIETDENVPLIPLGVPGVTAERLDFVMCNPPFYGSVGEMERGKEGKGKPPGTVCTGSKNEMITAGGEVAFISRIVNESLVLRERVQWYTSMVGKLCSLVPLIERLKKEGCVNWAVSELVQGSKTRRWVLAWSWTDWRPSMEVARAVGAGALEKKYLPFPSEYRVVLEDEDVEKVRKRLGLAMKELKWSWTWTDGTGEGVGFSDGDVWSRSARRKMKDKVEVETEKKDIHGLEIKFSVRITVKAVHERTEVIVRWLKGEDSVLFESFCGMVKRTVEGAPRGKRKADDITS